MDINSFVNITSRAWSIPILAHFHQGVPGRQATLLTATGAGRTAFAQSMKHLIEIGLAERNPGHGHPLRPEFRLTKTGKIAAKMAWGIYQSTEARDHDIIRKSWTLPILSTLQKPSYFSDIKRNLHAVTDRALAQSLRGLEEREWIKRDVSPIARPPRPLYCAINEGAMISKITSGEVFGGTELH